MEAVSVDIDDAMVRVDPAPRRRALIAVLRPTVGVCLRCRTARSGSHRLRVRR